MVVEQTLMLIKPDAMERNLSGEIIARYQKAGFKLVALKIVKVKRSFAARHYRPANKEWVTNLGHKTLQAVREKGKPEDVKNVFGTENPSKIGKRILKWTIDNLTRMPIIAFVLEGENAVAEIRRITGYTDPARSEKGTVRGDLGQDSITQANLEGRPVKNLVHASGTPDEAKSEIALWFKPKEIWSQQPAQPQQPAQVQ